MSSKTLLTGFIIGGVAAGLTTLLNAPKSGKETRKQYADNSKVLLTEIQQVKQSILQLKDSIRYITVEGKATISTIITEIRSSIHEWKSEISPHQEQLQLKLEELETTLSSLEKKIDAVTNNQNNNL